MPHTRPDPISPLPETRPVTQPHGRRGAPVFPWAGLSALAAAGFITILTEALPAGLLPAIGADLQVSESLAGQLVTVYAVGSLVSAIPLVAFTASWRRKPLLLLAIAGFLFANLVTALSTAYPLTLAARFGAGVFAGLLWALLAGHAGRMVPRAWQGKAIAVAMAGTPLALAVGIPAGTFLGTAVGWRTTFLLMSLLSVGLLAWTHRAVPDFPGTPSSAQQSFMQVLRMPGLATVLTLTLLFVLAHNLLYTYIAPWLAYAGMPIRVDTALLTFGAAALPGIWAVGMLVDRWLRSLVLLSIAGFGLAALLLGMAGDHPAAVLAGLALWGLAFGGTATLFQTASARAAGTAADVAQAMIVTVWNAGIAAGGLAGAVLLQTTGAGAFVWAVGLLMLVCYAIARRRSVSGGLHD